MRSQTLSSLEGASLQGSLFFVLDTARARLLASTLQYRWVRTIYVSSPLRLGASFLFLCAVYLPVALRRPDLLLVFGPLLLGYPHLIASYRFLQTQPRLMGLRPFVFFSLVTAASTSTRLLTRLFGLIPEMPLGAWELLAATATAIIVRPRILPMLACGVVAYGLWRCSWQEPLIFAALALLAHNWIAFFVWIREADGWSRITAIASATVFGAVHLLVFAGSTDFMMPLTKPSLFATLQAQNTGALLAPWSDHSLIWYRTLVMYTFGLSLHYFVWLKAIPECRGQHPLSWRRSYEQLRRDTGKFGLALAFVVWSAGLLIWLCNLERGSRFYFQVATFHGWLELMFLIRNSSLGVLGAWLNGDAKRCTHPDSSHAV